MNPKIILIISLVVFLLNEGIVFSANDSNKNFVGLVISKPSHKDIVEALNADKVEIENLIKSYKGKISWEDLNYSNFYVDVPKESYDNIVENLRNKGYEVRTELSFTLFLNESLSAIGAPYTCFDTSMNKFNLTGYNKRIGIIDTGIDPNHPDLKGKILDWRDSVEIVKNNNLTSLTPYDNDGHGTLVASVAAGSGDASGGKFKGVAPGAVLLVARACDSVVVYSPSGESTTNVLCNESYVEDAIQWMILNRADVIVMSFGTLGADIPAGDAICTDMGSGVNTAIADAVNHGIILVAAAGNEGPLNTIGVSNTSSISYQGIRIHPACLKDVISVGMSYKKDQEFNITSENENSYYTAGIHVIIEVNGVKQKEYEWQAYSVSQLGDYSKSGFDVSLTPSSWPATVKIKFEGMDRLIKFNTLIGNIQIYEKWWPGNESKGDAFWNYTYTFNQGNNIVVQFSAWPKIQTYDYLGWTYHRAWYSSPDTVNHTGILYENIFLNVFNTSQGLKDVASFMSDRSYTLVKPYPDVVAPGDLICAANSSETNHSYDNTCGNNQYISVTGTSFSAPHVAGLVALLKEANPSSSYNEIRNATIQTADLIYSDIWNSMGHGRINVTSAVKNILKWSQAPATKGYADNVINPNQCNNFDYSSYSSGNQIRNYTVECPYPNYGCDVSYDSFIDSVCVNGNCGSDSSGPYSTSDVTVQRSSNIEAMVEIKNVGSMVQKNWFVGVEFSNVSNFSNAINTKDTKGRINAFYNNKDKTHGCIQNPSGNCPSGVDCSIISESNPNPNDYLYPGETIKLKCVAPASFYNSSSSYLIDFGGRCDNCGILNGVMLWVHERDLGQDAGNDGNGGNTWWDDALAKSFRKGIDDPVVGGPANVKVGISSVVFSNMKDYFTKGYCLYYTNNIPSVNWDSCVCVGNTTNWAYCLSTYGTNKSACETDPKCWWGLQKQLPAGDSCQYCFKNCKDFGSNYICYDGACRNSLFMPINITVLSPGIGSINDQVNIPLKYSIANSNPMSWISYSLDGQPNVTLTGPINLTTMSSGWNNIIIYAGDNAGNVGYSNKVYFFSCVGDVNNDHVVNMRDIATIIAYFNYKCGNSKYNAIYDLNGDCVINMKDVAIAVASFMNKCPF